MKKRNIFYHCYDTQRPSGGQKSTYQHVDVLNKSGFSAFAVHTSRDFRLSWFPNETKTICWSDMWRLYDPAFDILVFPEDLGIRIIEYPGKKVIFNKCLYNGFRALGISSSPALYDHPDLLGVITVSEHHRRHLHFAFPTLPVFFAIHSIVHSNLSLVPLNQKIRQGAYVVKNHALLATIMHIYRAREQRLRSHEKALPWIGLENMNEENVCRVLRDSLFLLFPSIEEGLGRAAIEGLLSGCVVMAPDCGPVSEYLPTTLRFPCGDAVQAVTLIEDLIKPDSDLSTFQDQVDIGRSCALRYTEDAQTTSVCSIWEQLLAL